MMSSRWRTSVRGAASGLVSLTAGISLLATVLGACSTFESRYFLEVAENRAEWAGRHSTFLRLDISGYTIFTKSRFEKGWYDRDAVDMLFSTIVSKVGSDFYPTAGSMEENRTSDGAAQPLDRVFRVWGPSGNEPFVENKRLVIFATANPNDLVNRISTSIRTSEMASQVANLLSSRQTEEARDARLSLNLAGKRQETVIVQVDALLQWLDEAQKAQSLDPAALRQRIDTITKTVDSSGTAH